MSLQFSGTARSCGPVQGDAVLILRNPAELEAESELPSGRGTVGRHRFVASLFGQNDADGWLPLNEDHTADVTAGFKVDTNNTCWWLAAWNIPNGKVWSWSAPEKFLGDHSDKFGRLLSYRVWTFKSDSRGDDVYVRLTGGEGKFLSTGTHWAFWDRRNGKTITSDSIDQVDRS
jgi:hypothetical protein